MTTVTLSIPNAVLFVLDRSNTRLVVPEFIDGQLIAATGSAVSVGTQASVDGDVTVSLEGAAGRVASSGLTRVFRGDVVTPGRKIAIVTSELHTILEADVDATTANVEVWVDDDRSPVRVIVVFASSGEGGASTDHLPCPCCGSRVLTRSGEYEICGVCGWEDDPAQASDPDLRGGANKPSLKQARVPWSARQRRTGRILRVVDQHS
jgi:hypothetical protein